MFSQHSKTFTSIIFSFIISLGSFTCSYAQEQELTLNDKDYFEMPGLNVMVFDDFYPEGHQGGVSIIQNGKRIATNGDIRLGPAPGQWQPLPKKGERSVDQAKQRISMTMSYPDSSRHRQGFNPMIYPDLQFDYKVNVQAEGQSFRITVDLEEPLPEEWIGKVGFNMELFPGLLYGKYYYMDDSSGIFPRQANGPMRRNAEGELHIKPLAEGKTLTIAPEDDARRMQIKSPNGELTLLDGRGKHNNGWFVVRSTIPEGATENAIEWVVTPHAKPGWKYDPVIHISQVGYHPDQDKTAVVELDKRENTFGEVKLKRVLPNGEEETVLSENPDPWGEFLRYQYIQFDFSDITQEGIYRVVYGTKKTLPFEISSDIYDRHVWQPTLEYYLPVQMCHMRVNDKYRVWHGLCHMDDALRAPDHINHFDGYSQGEINNSKYGELEHVPGLNQGGWHDAGDYDLRVESQAGTVLLLSLIYENFQVNYDQTMIDQVNHHVEIHQPDGKPDVLQQVEHGVLAVLEGYKKMGKDYRGIIVPTLRQYVHLGDASTMTDNQVARPNEETKEFEGLWYTKVANEYSKIFDPLMKTDEIEKVENELDDRLVFTQENPSRTYNSISSLSAASRALKGYNDSLATECLSMAEHLWQALSETENRGGSNKIQALAELILTTGEQQYREKLKEMLPQIRKNAGSAGWTLGRVMPLMEDESFVNEVREIMSGIQEDIEKAEEQNPFGVPYEPNIWGAGWGIQEFGMEQYFLHTGWPDLFDKDLMLNALNFVLGCHPGQNTSSFASGVGSKSLTVAYGVNRADWSFIPGGVGSGTALI
ncbi:MAG: glycoside hydrolase family 9 protein, partial [Bacteroidota bacterium]